MIHYLYLGRVPYDEALRIQAEIAALRLENRIENVLLLLEHPPVLTLGRNAHRGNVLASDALLAARGVTLHEINRGGDVTYHGPGQLVGYPIFDLRSLRGPQGGRMGPVDFVRGMEDALIRLCAEFGVTAGRIPGLTGAWCGVQPVVSGQPSVVIPQSDHPGGNLASRAIRTDALTGLDTGALGEQNAGALKGHDFSRAANASEPPWASAPEGRSPESLNEEDIPAAAHEASHESEDGFANPERKIGAIGIHVARGITSHGFAFNVTTDLRDFELIIPCGIPDHAVTSLQREVAPGIALPGLEALAQRAAQLFAAVFDEPVAPIDSLAVLRAQAAHAAAPQFPAEDIPLHIPPELERLHSTAERPVRA